MIIYKCHEIKIQTDFHLENVFIEIYFLIR